jgi:hypothetical protein
MFDLNGDSASDTLDLQTRVSDLKQTRFGDADPSAIFPASVLASGLLA